MWHFLKNKLSTMTLQLEHGPKIDTWVQTRSASLFLESQPQLSRDLSGLGSHGECQAGPSPLPAKATLSELALPQWLAAAASPMLTWAPGQERLPLPGDTWHQARGLGFPPGSYTSEVKQFCRIPLTSPCPSWVSEH